MSQSEIIALGHFFLIQKLIAECRQEYYNVIRKKEEKQIENNMILKKQIPRDFYKLFRTQNMDCYMMLLVSIYEENSEGYSSFGLTIEECSAIIRETIVKAKIEWKEESEDESGEASEMGISDASPSGILKRLIDWGWLKSDYDEKLNSYILSFPEYSQLFVELFQKLQNEDDSKERESILSIYSALFTYHSDSEKNNNILKSALRTSKNLGQLLSNMRDGMRAYFDELSGKKNFIGIQEVLVDEINNSDSKKYAILTTTDSFYRYKEAVKELISQILNENEIQKMELTRQQKGYEKDSPLYVRGEHAIARCEEANMLVYQVEREFDLIERKYNKLIEQKSIFAKRALARIHYILQEGADEEDNIMKFIHLLDKSRKNEMILEELLDKISMTTPFRTFCDNSFYHRRESAENEFIPIAVGTETKEQENEIADFVPKPLYTKKELNAFKKKNMKDGVFITTSDTVRSVEDLEKLLFLWQEMTESSGTECEITTGDELVNNEGFAFSELVIDERKR